jgi:hypothetical protein
MSLISLIKSKLRKFFTTVDDSGKTGGRSYMLRNDKPTPPFTAN